MIRLRNFRHYLRGSFSGAALFLVRIFPCGYDDVTLGAPG
jgi:hypothetical protein